MSTSYDRWTDLLRADPRPWLYESDEPAARFIAMACLGDPDRGGASLGRGGAKSAAAHDDAKNSAARAAVLAEADTISLLDKLPDWESELVSGHNSPRFGPNCLALLADMGVRGGDDERVEALLDAMLEHVDESGRFTSLSTLGSSDEPVWGTLPCDNHAVLDALVRYGRGDDPRVTAALAWVAKDFVDTPQGPGWRCQPHSVTGWRGPGRKADVCPQVTLEALRVFARLPEQARPPQLIEAASTALAVWSRRDVEKPYFFGHGRSFKTIKWPNSWYDALSMLETLGRYPELWREPQARAEDERAPQARDENRRALAELLACLAAYNIAADGTVTPQSCYRGFEAYSFGQKKRPSPFATARVWAVLAIFADLADEAVAIDVLTLRSSKGGRGTALPPRAPRA